MARAQHKNRKDRRRKDADSTSRGTSQRTSKKPDFSDAVLDASRFLNKGSSSNGDDDENEDFHFEDEELDSDEALGSEDDLDDYMAKGKRNNDQGLNEYGEDEEGWDSVDEGELMTLSEIWDRDDKDLNSAKKPLSKTKDRDLVFNDEDEDVEEEEEEDDDEEDSDSNSDSDSDSDSESEEEDPFDEMNISDSDEENVQLDSVMKNLKKNLPKEVSDKSRKQLINDTAAENEYSLPSQGDTLTFDDMLEDVDNLEGEEGADVDNDLIHDIAKHSKQLSELKAAELDEEEQHQLNSNENSAFAIPLPVNIQKRHDRRAAYEIQKDQVNRWKEIIAHNRDQKVLKFIPKKVELDKTAAFKADADLAVNDFEAKLNDIIDQSNTESKKTEDLFENIETAKRSKAEMLKRTNELRLMRELMYRGMKDSKRLKKIKSKAYRKQLRKEKLKEKLLISQANRQEGIEDEDEDDLENDSVYQRAKERMTLKHKNTSQWAKQMIKSGMSKDKSTREEMEEMLKQSESLRMKQLGKKNADESSEDERDLSDLEKDVVNMEEIEDEKLSKIGKGVLAMDFMKNAEERDRLAKLKEIEDLKKLHSDDYNNESQDNEPASGVNITMNSGRRLYTPSAMVAAEEMRKAEEKLMEELDEEDERLLQNRLAVKERESVKAVDTGKKRKHDDTSGKEDDDKDADEGENPWLMEDSEDSGSDDDNKTKSSTKIKLVDSSSSKLDKAGARIAKKLSKRKTLLKKERGDEENEATGFTKIENKETLHIIDPRKANVSRKAAKSDDEFESDGNDEDDIRIFKQSDLIKQAFAGDDVLVEEFEKEKHEVEEEEGDKEVNLTVPGWGSWAGAEDGTDDGWGVPRNNKKRKIVKTIQGVVSKDKRLDKGKANVIINEKVSKKNARYQTDKVPYPYKTWEEYERSLRVPLGKEWTTTQTHHRMITPKVITKFGSVIDPLKAPFSE